jgi:thiol-disulfide isomerase/thioredoxin
MRPPTVTICLLAATSGLAGAGCSTTGLNVGRPRVLPGVRTLTSVGETPESVVAGMPGASRSSGPLLVERRSRSQGRISGRVVDERGRPVAGAEVRLADGQASAGRSVGALTDEAGGFTLDGLRPGARYTLVADGPDDPRPLTGRSVAEAPDAGVRLVVRAPGRGAGRVGTVSERGEAPDDADTSAELFPSRAPRGRGPARINEDDLPPAPEADAPAARGSSARATRTAWRSSDELADAPRPSREPEMSATPERSVMGLPMEDDGPNPLPPARERPRGRPTPDEPEPFTPVEDADDGRAAYRPEPESEASSEPFTAGEGPLVPQFPAEPSRPQPDASPAPPVVPRAEAPSDPFPVGGSDASAAPPDSPEPRDLPPLGTEPSDLGEPARPLDLTLPGADTPGPAPNGPAPPPLEGLPSDPPPIAAPEAASSAEPAPRDPAFERPEAAGSALEPPSHSTEAPDDPQAESVDLSERIPDAPRTTWSELTAQAHARRSALSPRSVRRVGAFADAATRTREDRAAAEPVVRAACRFDNRSRRLVDFELPDLDGRPVRFRDIDADYILLDFWGTWCGPCRKAIPHLVGIQSRYDPQRLRVVGVAYEQGPPEARVETVRDAAERLGINYPLLIAEQDGRPCPLAEALRVQAYPTMVLLDRHGRVLWRDTGANPATLAKLDRVVAANTRATAGVVRR